MRADRKALAERPADEERLESKSAPSGFALLAKRISSWTTNCVVSALILVAGLAFGRQVLQWWADDEAGSPGPPPQLAMTDGLGDPTRSHHIEFGDAPWAVVRETVVGGRDEAARALRASCEELCVRGDVPGEVAKPSEGRFLASLSRRRPVAEEPGQWQLYEVEGGFPMVVGTRDLSAGSGGPQSERPGRETGHNPGPVVQRPRRVVTWGLAVPVAEGAWTLYAFHPSTRTSGLLAELPEIPLPPNSRKTLSMRVTGGGAIAAFSGTPEGAGWTSFFDRWFQLREWTPMGTWQRSGSTLCRRYARASGQPSQTVDVQFGPDGRGRTSGLLLISE